ncbi:MAG TPA: hypothetical protein VM911_19220 [Pyrinomonadaceae bacterium]|jgi:hypothetical protein|nr:hypothetical protein [Pyrinomonadaceae bacterium]
MSDKGTGYELTPRDKLVASLLKIAPWLSFFLVALPAPLYFLLQYFTTVEEAAVYILLAFTSLAIGSIAGLMVMIFFLVYRHYWAKRMRNKLAADGVTADELSWFMSELTTAERRALHEMESQNPLLADAYRETLASRVTAARVVATAKRDLMSVERRLNRVGYLRGVDTTSLQAELRTDRERLERARLEGQERRAEAEARLHTIEAAASRGASWTEMNFALQRLSAAREHIPLGLEAAQLEQQAREDTQRELYELEKRTALGDEDKQKKELEF